MPSSMSSKSRKRKLARTAMCEMFAMTGSRRKRGQMPRAQGIQGKDVQKGTIAQKTDLRTGAQDEIAAGTMTMTMRRIIGGPEARLLMTTTMTSTSIKILAVATLDTEICWTLAETVCWNRAAVITTSLLPTGRAQLLHHQLHCSNSRRSFQSWTSLALRLPLQPSLGPRWNLPPQPPQPPQVLLVATSSLATSLASQQAHPHRRQRSDLQVHR
mmetsp:Transcript_1903/g.4862  ORF Transcript_1903/g.4862 Transcript_1903/m.4862 type:complete len:214 (-) Transcript_1903:525-1166(-)